MRAFAGIEIGAAESLVAVAVCAFGGEVEIGAGTGINVCVDSALSVERGDESN